MRYNSTKLRKRNSNETLKSFNRYCSDPSRIRFTSPVVQLGGKTLGLQSTYIPRVPQCLSSHLNWDPPPPPTQVSVSPPEPKEGGHTRLRLRGWGPQFGRREIALHSVYSVLRSLDLTPPPHSMSHSPLYCISLYRWMAECVWSEDYSLVFISFFIAIT